jgi:hypothetical protein
MLRDEDLRGVSYSDIFIDPATNVIGGTQNLVYLMFAFHRGKTNRTGKLLYGTSVRHSDVRRCGIGALGFYFYDLFHVRFASSCFHYLTYGVTAFSIEIRNTTTFS